MSAFWSELSPVVSYRFCMGSTGVLQVALGRSAADEYGANLSELSRRIVGNVGLFFTKLPREEVMTRSLLRQHCA